MTDIGLGGPSADSAAPVRILVVDDTAASARLLSSLLEIEGYDTIVTETGGGALDEVHRKHPDLVLLDLMLPDIDGHEVCRRLREDPDTRYLPVIVLTSAGNEERVRALEAGADDFLAKPIDQPELLARVRSLLRIKRYHDQIEAQSAQLEDLNKDLEIRVADQVSELARLSRLRRFFSESVAELITTADEEWLLETHRREIAVLFCDIRGFTAFTQSAEPEEVMALFRDFHGVAGECVRQHGATVGWLSGDGFMVFLNDPVPCAEPAKSAVALAESLGAAAIRFLGQRRGDGYELGIGQGIALGYATLGVLGVEDRVEYGPIGSVVNLASRLCDHAENGEILISQSMHSLLDDTVRNERVGPLALRGFPAPVTAWRLVGDDGARPMTEVEAAPLVSWPSAEAQAPSDKPNAFVRLDEDWALTYRGHSVRIRDSKGLGYLAQLIAAQGHEIHVFDLVGLSGPDSAVLRSDAGPVIDERAKEAYRRRVAELEAERDEAKDWGDLERVSKAQEEIDFITHELTSAYGLSGRPRKVDDPSERIRKAVTNRIRQTLTKIETVHPDLGRHLANSVRTGTFCSYAPEDEIEWAL